LIKAKKNRSPAKYFGNKKMTILGLDEISTFVEGKVVKNFFWEGEYFLKFPFLFIF